MNTLKEEIHAYWTQRAEGYSEYNQQEMADARRSMWKNKLLSLLEENFPGKNPEELKVLDVGTGPGFFALLLAEAGYQVTAADVTEEMLKEAKKNTGVFAEKITWKLSDAQKLELGDCEFDAVFSRNVTWNLENPGQAYEEWVRVLKPGGLLCNFDADWYGHLYDEEKRSGYEKDRQRVEEKNLEDYYTGTDIERMEAIARQVPLSRQKRPQWDVEALKNAGLTEVSCDTEVWKQVWTEEEIANNGSTPIFLLSGKKRESFCLNHISVEPGNVWTGYLELGQGEFRLPAAVLHGTRPGKTMLITAGVHGGEYVGIQAAIELSQKLKIQKVAGTIIIVKVINVPAFERRNGSMGLTDGKNLNREFPGNPKGTEMERLAWAVSHELQPAADYYIDLHSGDDYEQLTSYVYYAGMADEKTVSQSRRMAEQVDVPYMVRSNVASGGAYNYAASQGIPSILIERGGMGAWTSEEVRSTRRDVRNILCHLGIYQGKKDYRTYYPLDVTDICYQDASRDGLWYPFKKPGDMIREGEILGEVRDYEGGLLELSVAEYDGVILYQTGTLQVLGDGPMIAYGKIVNPYDERKERIVSYWEKRSGDFLEHKRAELHSPMSERWLYEIKNQLPQDRNLRVLDVGCGAGFFSVLLAKEGYQVTGVDLTPDMVENARTLAEEEKTDCEFFVMDAENLRFADESFDVVISRNLTWTLPDVKSAYREWVRVLKKGGILLNFDANYGLSDFTDLCELPDNHAHQEIGDDMMRECEEIKRQLPISSYSRPAWDLETLGAMKLQEFSVDLGISSRIYVEKDEFYNPTPMFMLRTCK
ncbi:ubiquinone/menaquinone biosynthesis C-methylase UbiE/predicted deacylase [Blautia caecimuris]|uniref:Ubiquinone/menaquinone biosynthesis C-methylase UbiE/predicted deacylase n=1 Tax=Blautia caecimuris TaxID=1796615 RepID=A0ABV2M684_9FIRM|nr:methyltransferase domain-containing protein [Blautia caecimuris]MCR2003306.1 methyltransferase domain-containing protein [Blautia caecimuris]